MSSDLTFFPFGFLVFAVFFFHFIYRKCAAASASASSSSHYDDGEERRLSIWIGIWIWCRDWTWSCGNKTVGYTYCVLLRLSTGNHISFLFSCFIFLEHTTTSARCCLRALHFFALAHIQALGTPHIRTHWHRRTHRRRKCDKTAAAFPKFS